MTPVRLTIIGVFIATTGLVLSLLGSPLWFVGTSLGCLCSASGVVWSARRAVSVSLTDYGVEITRRAREQVPVSAESLRALERTTSHRRPFEPFCECPGCGLPTYHLFSAPVEHVEARPEWAMGPGRVWVESDEDIRFSIFNKAGTYLVRHHDTGRTVVKRQVSMVVPRECLSCRHTWTEAVA